MAPHNRRGKAKEANNKEKRAQMFNQRPHTSHNHHSNNNHGTTNTGGSTSSSYLSSATPASERLRRFLQHQRTNAHSNSNNNNNNVGQRNHTSTSAPSHTYDEGNFFDAQIFDYIIVVDVEATCIEAEPESNIALAYPHEVIEFPAILIDVRRGIIDKEHSFHAYVKPMINPTLSSFCIELTGITQDKVDQAEPLTVVLEHFVKWFTETIPKGAKVVFAADGPWDFRNFFVQSHAIRDSIPLPTMFYEYIDIRTTFANVFHYGKTIKLDAMLHAMQLEFEGRPHCGFDDAYNIARLAVEMMRNGCIFDFLVSIPLHSKVLELAVQSDICDGAISNSVTTDVDVDVDVVEENHEQGEENSNPAVHSSNDDKSTERPEEADKATKKRKLKSKAKAKQRALLESESSKSQEVVKETRHFYYAIPGYPVYRRAEGSGHLDKDVVDDIAKNAFGPDYFTFGERHQQEVREYRLNANNSNANYNNNNKNCDIEIMKSKKAKKSYEAKKVVKRGENSKPSKSNSSSTQNYLIRATFAAMVCIIMLLLYCAYLLSSMQSKEKL